MARRRTTRTSTWAKYTNSKGTTKWWTWINNHRLSCKAFRINSNRCCLRYLEAREGLPLVPRRFNSNRSIRVNRISIHLPRRYWLCEITKRPIKHHRFCIRILIIQRSCQPKIKCKARAIWISLLRTSSSINLIWMIFKITRESWTTQWIIVC